MGRNLGEARRIVALCERRRLVAAVNLQLRYSPNMIALRALIARGTLGMVRDVEVRVNTYTPWRLWRFLAGIPRLEILYHSIHYLDLIRTLFGEPDGVHCVALGDPELPRYADTRSSIVLRYPGTLRGALYTNHLHAHGGKHAMSQLKVEGTRGAAIARMGVNLDYPRGRPDRLEVARGHGPWRTIELCGSWFPHAFVGPMASLQRYVTGEERTLPTAVADALNTMALVEACYRSAGTKGTRIRC
ncbi:MAG: Gfo/Idh/MocA family oxidoreductase [Planctomycetota bacterium]